VKIFPSLEVAMPTRRWSIQNLVSIEDYWEGRIDIKGKH